MDLNNLLSWGEPRRVETKNGPRIVQSAEPTEQFWGLWRANKGTLKMAGISVGQFKGKWQVSWWKPVDAATENRKLEKSCATSSDFRPPAPEGLEYLPYQRAGIEFAKDRKAVLIADEMGLGKTIQAIGLINTINPGRVLVVVPASLRLNWAKELSKWLIRPRSIHVVQGSDWQDSEIVVVNYDVLSRHQKKIRGTQWGLVILDEAHYAKNPKAKRTQVLVGNKDNPPVASDRWVLLTGTPILNRPVELFPLLKVLDPRGLGRSYIGFVNRYCGAKRTRWGLDVSGATNLEELQRVLRSTCMVRRLKSEVLKELPPKRRQIVTLSHGTDTSGELGAYQRLQEARRALQFAKDQGWEDQVQDLRDGVTAAFTELSKERAKLAERKLPYVVEFIQTQQESGEPVIVFAHHRSMVQGICNAFPDAVSITGDTPMEVRQEAVDKFQRGEASVFVGNIRAAGVGLTLTRSSIVIFAELDWTPANISQAEDRAHRIGQENSVNVYHLVLDGSLDSHMAKVLIDKQEVYDRALNNSVSVTESPEAVTEIELVEPKIFDPEKKQKLHEALRRLAGVCDGAKERDGMGFNGVDTRFGKALASTGSLSDRAAEIALDMVRKYKGQLGPLWEEIYG